MLFYDKLKKNQQKQKESSLKRAVAPEKDTVRHRIGVARALTRGNNTRIQDCIEAEMEKYFELLDGQAPHDLHRLVMSQVESTLIRFVLEECGNNQSRAAEYLGISRGTLRTKLTEQGLI